MRWRRANVVAFAQAIFFGFPFCVLGVTVGFVTALSREPSVGAVIPAILALVGSFGVFLVSKGGRTAITSVTAVVMLCVAFTAGIGYGARARVENERLATSLPALLEQARKEANVMRARKLLGLDPAGPIVTATTPAATSAKP